MLTQDHIDEILVAWRPPFRYEPAGIQVMDSNGDLVLDVRSWGRLEKYGEKRAAMMQDYMGLLIAELLNKFLLQSNEDQKASIRNKLGPFWSLVDLLLVDDDDLPNDADAYSKLIEDTAYKCRENKDLIIQELEKVQ